MQAWPIYLVHAVHWRPMVSQFESKFMSDFGSLLTQNKWKQVDRLEPLVGRMAAIALIGNERTSRDEITVLTTIISSFQPLNLYSYKMSPNKAVLSGRSPQGNRVLIYPQFRIEKPERIITRPNRTEYWYVDIAIKIFSRKDSDICIGLWAAEYDGHPQHLIESGITFSHFRDVVIDNVIGMRPVHITKNFWSSNTKEYIDNLSLHIDRANQSTDCLSLINLRSVYSNSYDSPELEIVGDGKIKEAISWELAKLD